MSRKHKRHSSPSPSGQSRPAGNPDWLPAVALSEEAEPVAERRPVPVWLIALLVLLIYVGDMYVMDHGADLMGKAGPFPKEVFDPFRTYQEVADRNPESPFDKAMKSGKGKYELYCSPCHGSSGLGNPATGIPPLAGSEWVKTTGPGRGIRIVLNAIRGPISVSGKMWDNPGMLAWGPQLSDEDIAAILSYVRANNDWGNKASIVTPAAVKQVRDANASRTDPWSGDEVQRVSETE